MDKETDYGSDYKLRNDFYLVKKDDDKIETNVIKNSTDKAIDGSIVGKVEVILNGEVIGSRNLYYEKVSVTKDKSFLSKLVDFLKFWWDMINKIWFLLIALGIGYSFISGNASMGDVILDSSFSAYDLLLSIGPLIVLWSGVMNIASKSGLLSKFSRLLSPLLKKIMPSVKNDKAMEYISSNIAANMLGLGSVATPAGLKAMKELDKENKTKGRASDAMITFLVLNTSGVTIIPMTVIALRKAYGSVNPMSIIVPSLIATTVSSISGLLLDYVIRRKNVK